LSAGFAYRVTDNRTDKYTDRMRIESSEDGNQVSFRVRDRESSGCSGREELSLGMVSFHYINPDPDLQFLEYSCGLCHVGIDSKLLLLLL